MTSLFAFGSSACVEFSTGAHRGIYALGDGGKGKYQTTWGTSTTRQPASHPTMARADQPKIYLPQVSMSGSAGWVVLTIFRCRAYL